MRNLQRFSSLRRNLLTPLNKKLKKMTKSALQIARAAYQPKLPKALASGAVKAVAGAATQSVADQEAIKALFPNTYGMPLITFEAGEAVTLPAMNVGVILSGGQAPGGHNVKAVSKPKEVSIISFFKSPSIVFGQPITCTPYFLAA